jgi:hypothetical protein
LDGSGNTPFSRHGDEWKCFPAAQIRRLWFSRLGASCDKPAIYTHVISTVKRNGYVEITEMVKCQQPLTRITPTIMSYQSCLGTVAGALSLHVQRLIGCVWHFQLPTNLDCTIEVDIIIEMDGLLFGVGYHSWLIATMEEEILMAGGGPDDGAQDVMASYRSELGGIAAGLGAIGILAR